MTMLTPPSEPTLALEAPKPVEPVQEETAVSMIPPVDPGRKLEIGQQAKGFVTDLSNLNPNSPEFADKLKDVQSLAQQEIVRSGKGTNALLERKSTSLAGSKKNGGDVSVQVAGTLSDLRNVVEDLTPNAADLTGVEKILGIFPGGKKIRRYFRKYESAQSQLDGIVKSLMAGQDALIKDNAALESEKVELWSAMGELNEYIVFAQKLDEELVSEISRLKNSGNIQAANAIETDMLFTVRQRRQDLMTQLAVAIQGYMAMELVRKNNVELIKGVDRSRTTTIFALRTAVAVAQALDTQKLVLDQIDALNTATDKVIDQTSTMLRQQTARVHEQATNSGVSVETLTRAFDNIFATMDEIDNFMMKANDSMEQTINSLGQQLERAKPNLERMRAVEAAEGNNKSITR